MDTRTYRALLVANSTFPYDAQNLPELEGPRNDAALLRDALCDREYGLFSSSNVRLVQERPMGGVLRELEDFLRSASRQDTLLLYYSGHGVLDQSNEFFLCAQDSRTDRLRSTAIKSSDVSQMIDESAAATTLILLDCCHSGRFKGGDLPSKLAGQGRFVVTSSRGGELAQDAHAQNHASLFTHHLVEGMMGRAPDRDGDGVVCLSDLYDYVHDALRDSGRQIPQKRFEGTGDVPIAMRPGADTESAQPGLLDPAGSGPILDVSETEIDLGLVPGDEELPPERILVINRGGGTLEWTVRASDGWVEPVPDETGVDLHLRPAPGPNRANVYITDERTGLLKTVRIRVRVDRAVAAVEQVDVPAKAPAVVHEPASPPPSAADETSSPAGPAAPASRLARAASVLTFATPVGMILVAIWTFWSARALSGEFSENSFGGSGQLFLRGEYDGPTVSLTDSVLIGAAGAVAAVVALVSLRRGGRWVTTALCTETTSAIALMLWRGADSLEFHDATYWYESRGWFVNAGFGALIVAVATLVTVGLRGGVVRRPSVPGGPEAGALGLVVIWAISLGHDLYRVDDYLAFGDRTQERGDGSALQIVAIAVLVALVLVAVTVLTHAPAIGVLLGVASVVLATVLAEVYFVAANREPGVTAWRLPILAVPALILVGWYGMLVRRLHRASGTASSQLNVKPR